MYYQYRQSSGNIGDRLKKSFVKGNALTRLIYINIGIFLLVKIIHVLIILFGQKSGVDNIILENLGISANPSFLLTHPWTVFTYMFTQFDFFHLLFNMLWLYWFGSFFLKHFTQKELTGVYLLGGICGALLYVTVYNLFPAFELSRYYSWAVGASASVMAIVFAVCLYLPQQHIYIFLIGPVKLIYLALFTAAIDILSIPSSNAGGHIAHLGGALFGYLFVLSVKHNRNIAGSTTAFFERIGRFFTRLFTDHKKMHIRHKKNVAEMNDREYNAYKKQKDDRINKILDKISRSGYESLTKEEKEILFRSGK
ncbi:rhomboid family intramembrane serine protease [uncultured Odoribacter sp.]|uniref:rhomboid family protein n=1 Tax=uncultured Odoribacter sp. TaxID=876416 RepID=UPI00262915A3|nr:rhomboid family intramembrane serine protease [uncultured Odoribacter sp.]